LAEGDTAAAGFCLGHCFVMFVMIWFKETPVFKAVSLAGSMFGCDDNGGPSLAERAETGVRDEVVGGELFRCTRAAGFAACFTVISSALSSASDQLRMALRVISSGCMA
jgi:hypothetical protein